MTVDSSDFKPMEVGDAHADGEEKEKTTYSLEVLQIIKEQQAQHGLRHGDYQRYRGYCSRRLRRVRKTLGFTQHSKHRFQKKKVTIESVVDAKFLLIPLMCAERAWAYAMQLKQEANSEPRKRFHLIERLRKAVSHAGELAAFGEALGDARTKLETRAYDAWMNGALDFELEKWGESLRRLDRAKTIYKKLADAFPDEIKAVYMQKVEEIEPSVRYCAYNIGDETAIEDLLSMRMTAGGLGEDLLTAKLDALISQTRRQQAATLSEVTFRGRTIPVKSEKVRVFLLGQQEAETSLKNSDPSERQEILEKTIDEVKDALAALQDEIKNDPNAKPLVKSGVGAKSEGRLPHAQYLLTYLSFIKRDAIIRRNAVMIAALAPKLDGEGAGEARNKATKPQDLVRLHDGIVQMLTELAALPGLEDDDQFQAEVDAKIAYYKAHRCLYVAYSYAQAKKFQESAALYERVLTYVDAAVKGWTQIPDGEDKQKALDDLKDLRLKVEGKKYGLHVASILDAESIADGVANLKLSQRPTEPLIDRMDEYVEDPALLGGRGSAIGNAPGSKTQPNLVPFPPELKPIPCKPLFFDLALNNLSFPSLQHKMESSKKGSSWGSWFSWGK